MSRNLEKFNRSSNTDWSEWVKVVKRVYKAQGYNLTQQQALIVAREHYPGKGNVIDTSQKKLESQVVVNENVPPNPTRKKKEPLPKEKPTVYKREKPVKKSRRHEEYESSDESPPRRKKTKNKKKEESPLKRRPKKKYYYSSSSESEEEYEYVKRRKRRD